MIAWSPPLCRDLAAPNRIMPILQKAIAAAPAAAAPWFELGNIHLDLYRYAAAAEAFENCVQRDPGSVPARLRLARALHVLGRHGDVLDNLPPAEGAVAGSVHLQRGLSLLALGLRDEADAAFAQALEAEPGNRRACMMRIKSLRRDGRLEEVLALCEDLAAQGVRHAQLLLDWGRALALAGRQAQSARLLLDPARLRQVALAEAAAINPALREEILSNPFRVSEFAPDEEANRGSSRVHHLFCGCDPSVIETLLAAIQQAVEAHVAGLPAADGFDPWLDARPRRARLNPWGLIQTGTDHETWHTHRGGWLSGVYYIALPAAVSKEGPGCLEFGPPPALAERGMPPAPSRVTPREGMLVLAPSHYHHRTIPTGVLEPRISFAFDVVPLD